MGTVVHSTLTSNDLHFSKIQVVTGSPSITPTFIGQSIYDTLNKIFYVANGVSSAANWQVVNNFNLQTGSTYTVLSTDNRNTIGLTDAALRTITLPTQPINGFMISIKDEAGDAYTYPIIVNVGGGADIFDGGLTSTTLTSEYESISLVYDLTNTTWMYI